MRLLMFDITVLSSWANLLFLDSEKRAGFHIGDIKPDRVENSFLSFRAPNTGTLDPRAAPKFVNAIRTLLVWLNRPK